MAKIPNPRFKLISDVSGDSAEAKWSCFMFYGRVLLQEAEDSKGQGKWGAGGAPRRGGPRVGCQHLVYGQGYSGCPM